MNSVDAGWGMIERMIRKGAGLGIALVIAVAAGCSSQSIRPQALQLDDRDLASIEHQLVMFTVHIHPASENLKLRGMVARNLDTGQGHSFPFFSNAILKSSAIPYTVDGDRIEHMIFLDLPAGTYEIREFDFAQYADAGGYNSVMRHELEKRVRFQVGDNATYLGRLVLGIGDIRIVDIIVPQSPVSLVNEINKLAGEITIVIDSAAEEDRLKARQRYRALADQSFDVGAMTFAP